MNYETKLSYDSVNQINNFLSFAKLLENKFLDNIFYAIRRIGLYEKAKLLLPRLLQKIEDQNLKSLLN